MPVGVWSRVPSNACEGDVGHGECEDDNGSSNVSPKVQHHMGRLRGTALMSSVGQSSTV